MFQKLTISEKKSLATNYIIQLDKSTRQMQTRLAALENEVQRLRALNEKISLSVGAGSPEGPGLVQPMPHSIERMSPPPENKAMSQLTSVTTQPLREDSSGSERGL